MTHEREAAAEELAVCTCTPHLAGQPDYPDYLSTNARRTLAGLGSPALPARGESVTITEHRFHPAQTYTLRVNAWGDVEIAVTTRNTFGFSHGSGYCICRNPN